MTLKNEIKTVDVVIPTYKPGEEFRNVLQRLAGQNRRIGHILVINTDEAFWDPSLTEGFGNVEVFQIRQASFDHAATRDMGADLSDADAVVFMTQDAVPRGPDLIDELLRPLECSAAVKAAYARQLPKEGCRPAERLVRAFNYPAESRIQSFANIQELGVKAFFCSDVCAAYDRRTFAEMKGFAAPCIFNEDSIFAARLLMRGYSVAYAAGAEVFHSHNYSCIRQFHRNFDNGVSRAMHPEIYAHLPADREGKKLFRYVVRGLEREGEAARIPGFIMECGFRWLGFHLGLNFRHLPRGVVRMCTMNKGFWDWKPQGE